MRPVRDAIGRVSGRFDCVRDIARRARQANYLGKSAKADGMLAGQHNIHWVTGEPEPPTGADATEMLVFDNMYTANSSAVRTFSTPTPDAATGLYALADGAAFEPANASWT